MKVEKIVNFAIGTIIGAIAVALYLLTVFVVILLIHSGLHTAPADRLSLTDLQFIRTVVVGIFALSLANFMKGLADTFFEANPRKTVA